VSRGARSGPPPAADTTPGERALAAKKRPRREKPPPILEVPDLPVILDTTAFREALAARLRERAEQPGPAARQTAEQIGAQIRQLARVAEVNGVAYAIDCVERATGGHHQGVVFPEDKEPRNGSGRHPPALKAGQKRQVTAAEFFARESR